MERIHTLSEADPDCECSQPVRICAIHQDNGCAKASAEFREKLERACGRTETNSWSFESLRIPAVRHAATVDAVGSRLLLLAAREGAELPSHLKFWIGGFLGSRSGGACTVVALLNAKDARTADDGPVQRYLHTIARLDGMDFVCRKFTEPRAQTQTLHEKQVEPTPFHAVLAGSSVFEDVDAFHELQDGASVDVAFAARATTGENFANLGKRLSVSRPT